MKSNEGKEEKPKSLAWSGHNPGPGLLILAELMESEWVQAGAGISLNQITEYFKLKKD